MSPLNPRRCLQAVVGLLLFPVAVQLTVQGQARVPPAYALVNARIVASSARTIESGTLVMRDGRIAAVGPDLAAPADAIVIDAAGWTLYPGFIDAHSNLGMAAAARPGPQAAREAADRRDRGEPTPGLDPHLRASVRYAPTADALDATRQTGVTAAAVAPADGILEGQSAVVALRGGPPQDAIIRDRWAQHIAFEPFPFQRGDYPGTLMGVMATIRQHYSDAAWYAEAWRRFDVSPTSMARPRHDERLEALSASQSGDQPVVFSAWSDNAILRALSLSEELGLRGVVSGAIDGWRVADQIRSSGVPLLVSLDQRPRRDPSGFGAAPPGGLMAHPGAEDTKDAESNAARLHAAGVRFAFTAHGLDKPSSFLPNLRKAVAAGLPRDAALAALTSTPAEWLGVGATLGSLEVGKAAHVVAVEGDLFEDGSRVAAVWVDGERYDAKAGSGADGGDRRASGAGTSTGPAPSDTDDEEDRRALTERRAPAGPLWPVADATAIRHATILTVSSGTIESGTILVRDGRIAAVGPDAAVTVPSGTREIDATGLYVMPGIVDAHIHIAMAGGGNESTESVTPEVRIADVIDHRSPAIFRALTLGVTTVNVLHGSANVIGGQNAVLKMRWGQPAADLFVAGAPPGVKFALGENPKQSNRPQVPGLQRRYPSTRMGVELELRASFTRAREYRAEWRAYEAAKAGGADPMPPRRDLRLETLAGILDGRILVHAHCYRSDEILMLLRVADDFGFRIASLQHVLEGYKVADEIAAHGAGASTFADGWGYKMEAFDAIPYNMAIMAERGVTVSINSDAVGELGTRLFTEAAKAMKYGGVSEQDALRMITLNPASHLRLDDRIGSVDVGKDADLAIFTAHPFSADARVQYTLVDGQVYFDAEKVERVAEVVESSSSEDDDGAHAGNGSDDDAPATSQPADGSRSIADRFVPWERPAIPGSATAGGGYGDQPEPRFPATGAVAIVGGRIVTMAGPPIESGTVLIQDGRIVAVGTDVEVPAGARVIDAAGLIVTPGLINAGTALGLTEIGAVSATQDANEGADVNAAVRAAVAVHPHSEMLPVTRVNGVTTAVAAPGGGIINGQSALIDLAGWTPPDLVARSPLAMHIDFPELLEVPDDATAATEARERVDTQRETLRQWMRRAQAFAGGLASGSVPESEDHDDLVALVPVVRGELPVVIEAQSEEGIGAALAFVADFSLEAILEGSRDVWKVIGSIKAAGVPVILGSLPGRAPDHDPYDAIVATAARLQQAGVPFAFQTGGASDARNLAYDAGLAVAHGLSREAAWHAMTAGAAAILGVDDLYGTLEAGKVANLVVADGDLLDVPTGIRHVLIRGQEIDLSSRHTRLWQTFRARPSETR